MNSHFCTFLFAKNNILFCLKMFAGLLNENRWILFATIFVVVAYLRCLLKRITHTHHFKNTHLYMHNNTYIRTRTQECNKQQFTLPPFWHSSSITRSSLFRFSIHFYTHAKAKKKKKNIENNSHTQHTINYAYNK